MPTECRPTLFEFAPVKSRAVVAAFNGGAATSDVGALLLGTTDRAIHLVDRFAACFTDHRCPELIVHRNNGAEPAVTTPHERIAAVVAPGRILTMPVAQCSRICACLLAAVTNAGYLRGRRRSDALFAKSDVRGHGQRRTYHLRLRRVRVKPHALQIAAAQDRAEEERIHRRSPGQCF